MQQTETYKLNLIDTDDTFSPQPINENMGKLETVLSALDGADEALGERVTALEAHKLAVGSYKGSTTSRGVSQTITLGFKPQAVYVFCARLGHCMATQAHPYHTTGLVLTENGFKASNNDNCSMNYSNDTFLYLAVK